MRTTLPRGRWQECLGNLSEATLDVAPGTWFHDLQGPDAVRLVDVSVAADKVACMVASWTANSTCDSRDIDCVHKTRSVIVAIGLWLAVASRNGQALSTLLSVHETTERAHVACSQSACAADRPVKCADKLGADEDVGQERTSNACSQARAMVAEATGAQPHTFLDRHIGDVVDACFGRVPGEPRVTLASRHLGLDEPGPSELALGRIGAATLDPLALVVADILCQERCTRCATQIEQNRLACGIALPVLVPGARPDMFDLERVVSACDALWHLDEGVEIVALAIDSCLAQGDREGGEDDGVQKDCILRARGFAAWACMPLERASACRALINHRLALGPFGATHAMSMMARDPPRPAQDDRIHLSHHQRRRRNRDRKRADAFCSLGLRTVEYVTAAVWHIAQVPERGCRDMLRMAIQGGMGDARYARSWPFIVNALLARGLDSVDAARAMIHHESRHTVALVFDALSMPHLWNDASAYEEKVTLGQDDPTGNDDDEDRCDLPPLYALVNIAHAHPEIALDPAHAVAMAHILASMHGRCYEIIGAIEGDDDDGGDNVICKGAIDREAFIEGDLVRFDASLWVAAIECLLLVSKEECKTEWLRQVFLEPRIGQARAFASAVCRAHDCGTLALEPLCLYGALVRFAAGDVDVDQLAVEGPCGNLYIPTL